jgi:hypothetical protein
MEDIDRGLKKIERQERLLTGTLAVSFIFLSFMFLLDDPYMFLAQWTIMLSILILLQLGGILHLVIKRSRLLD